MEQSVSIKELASALSKAQAEMHSAKKLGRNPHYKSTHATLESFLDGIREPFAKYGLALSQPVDVDADGRVYLATILMHSSGEWLKSARPLCEKSCDPQGVGSSITYARRYDGMSMVGMPAEDDDGERAMARHKETETKKEEPKKAIDFIFPFPGPWKGKRLGELTPQDLFLYVEDMIQQAKKAGKELKPQAQELVWATNAIEEDLTGLKGYSSNPDEFNPPF